jgi:RNA polymerase sigma-70 factor (ECF subfamily)
MDDDALRAELERLHPESYGWALGCCGHDPAQAEEILQMAYLKILDGRARYRGEASFKTWLLALIRKTAADEWRRKNRRDAHVRAWELENDFDVVEAPIGDARERAEIQSALLTALATLTARQQEVLQLVFYHDLSLSEAAAVMGIAIGSVRTHYERGKERLRECLKQEKVFDESGIGR